MGDFKIYLTNLGLYNEGILKGCWLNLPFDDQELEKALVRIGINGRYEEYFITDYETPFSDFRISEYQNLKELNEFCERLEDLDGYDTKKFDSVLEFTGASIDEAMELIDELDNFDLYDVHDDEELGSLFAEEFGALSGIPEHLISYFDLASYGRDIRLESNSGYTSMGLVFDNR